MDSWTLPSTFMTNVVLVEVYSSDTWSTFGGELGAFPIQL